MVRIRIVESRKPSASARHNCQYVAIADKYRIAKRGNTPSAAFAKLVSELDKRGIRGIDYVSTI